MKIKVTFESPEITLETGSLKMEDIDAAIINYLETLYLSDIYSWSEVNMAEIVVK